LLLADVNYPRKVFTFDHVYDTRATNEEIYTEVVSPLVESVLDGYNGCIFAYGQTSCGKTFSMQGKYIVRLFCCYKQPSFTEVLTTNYLR